MLCKNSWHFLLLANQTNSNWLQWVVRARSWLSGSEECCWIKGIKAGAKQLLLVSVHDGPVSSQWSAAVKIHSWAGSSSRRSRRSRSEFQQCRLLSAIVAPALPLLASAVSHQCRNLLVSLLQLNCVDAANSVILYPPHHSVSDISLEWSSSPIFCAFASTFKHIVAKWNNQKGAEGGEAKAANPDQAIGEADTLTRPVCSDQKCESLDQLSLLLAQEEGGIKSLITTQLQKSIPTLF